MSPLVKNCVRSIALGCALSLNARVQQAQVVHNCTERNANAEFALAERYAPQLLYAEAEEERPTFAFAEAFSGIRTGGDSLAFNTPQKVAPHLTADNKSVSWNTLDKFALNDDSTRNSWRQNFVFYRIRCTDKNDTELVRRFLRKDPQAWRRTEMGEVWREDARFNFVVVEYYFYYLNDNGLRGRAQDIEYLYVFVPNDTELARKFHINVGAGHDERVPNGVLVAQSASTNTFAAIEYGGHATVPMRDNASTFRFGIDVNWHVPDTWGPRDLMAVSGLGFRGKHLPQYSFVRGTNTFSVLDSTARRDADFAKRYRLLNAVQFSALFTEINNCKSSCDGARVLQSLSEINTTSKLQLALPASLSSDVLNAMQLWTLGLNVNGHIANPAKHQVWLHKQYRYEPSVILRDHLYRPADWYKRGLDQLSWGVRASAGEAIGPYVGLLTPMPASGLLYVPGFVELSAGLQSKWPRSATRYSSAFASLTYDKSYRDYVGFFAQANYAWYTSKSVDAVRRPFTLTAGPSLLVWSYARRNTDWRARAANSVRIRIGPEFHFDSWNNLIQRTGLEVRVGFRQ